MLPTVDFCFKELMKNPKVRRGFIAALSEEGAGRGGGKQRSCPENSPGEYEDEKLGILDVLIRFRDGSRMNLEMQNAGVRLLEGEGSVLSLQDLYRAAEKGEKATKI